MDLDACYDTLGVEKGASQDAIKKAFRRKSLQYHPDRNGNSLESTEMFKKINNAYETLTNSPKNPDSETVFGDGPIDINAFVKMFTGMNKHPSFASHIGRQLQKPVPIIKRIQISLEQVYSGCMIPIEITRTIKLDGESREETETLYVDIKKGADTNEMMVFREKGHVIDDAPGGDVKVFVSVSDHPTFKRSGLDLIYTRCISLKEALCGVDFEFTHLSGRTYKINNNGNGQSVIHPGYRKVVPGLGLQREGHTGNMLIEFNITFPDKLSAEQIIAIKNTL